MARYFIHLAMLCLATLTLATAIVDDTKPTHTVQHHNAADSRDVSGTIPRYCVIPEIIDNYSYIDLGSNNCLGRVDAGRSGIMGPGSSCSNGGPYSTQNVNDFVAAVDQQWDKEGMFTSTTVGGWTAGFTLLERHIKPTDEIMPWVDAFTQQAYYTNNARGSARWFVGHDGGWMTVTFDSTKPC